MYTLAVQRQFEARHYLIGGNWRAENQPHSHHYTLEVQLQGRQLDQHGYLLDIVDLNRALDDLVAGFAGRLLNELASFAGLNPSIEHFARIAWEQLAASIQRGNLENLVIKVGEDQIAWTAFSRSLQQ